MKKLAELQTAEFVDLLASDAPAPGGGSAAALEGALGAALSAMVCGLTTVGKSKEKYADYQEFVIESQKKLTELKVAFVDVMDRDTEAFNVVSAAFGMPKATDEEKDAALKFFEFISRPENAQLWSDIDGAPSCLLGTVYSDPRVSPVIDKAATGVVCDWFGSKVTSQVTSELYQVVQGLLMDGDLDAYVAGLDEAIENAAL